MAEIAWSAMMVMASINKLLELRVMMPSNRPSFMSATDCEKRLPRHHNTRCHGGERRVSSRTRSADRNQREVLYTPGPFVLGKVEHDVPEDGREAKHGQNNGLLGINDG